MITNLNPSESHAALRMILESNLASLNRLFVDFHAMMKKANEDDVAPTPIPQDRANHILDLMVSLWPFIELLREEFKEHSPVIQWLEENCKKIFKNTEPEAAS